MKCLAAEDIASVQWAVQVLSTKEAKESRRTGHFPQEQKTTNVQAQKSEQAVDDLPHSHTDSQTETKWFNWRQMQLCSASHGAPMGKRESVCMSVCVCSNNTSDKSALQQETIDIFAVQLQQIYDSFICYVSREKFLLSYLAAVKSWSISF